MDSFQVPLMVMDRILWQEAPSHFFPWRKQDQDINIDLFNSQIITVLHSKYQPRSAFTLFVLKDWLRWLCEDAKEEIPTDIWHIYESLRDSPSATELQRFWRVYQAPNCTLRVQCGCSGIVRGTTALSIWPASLFLCDWLMEKRKEDLLGDSFVGELRVLEIGCGLGIVGLTAVLSGLASFVCLTDANEEALQLVKENIEANELESGVASVFPHWWGTLLDAQAESCNVLLGSDVIYDPELFPALCQTIVHFLHARKGNIAFISLVVRSLETWRCFEVEAKKVGIQIQEHLLPHKSNRHFSEFVQEDSVKIVQFTMNSP